MTTSEPTEAVRQAALRILPSGLVSAEILHSTEGPHEIYHLMVAFPKDEFPSVRQWSLWCGQIGGQFGFRVLTHRPGALGHNTCSCSFYDLPYSPPPCFLAPETKLLHNEEELRPTAPEKVSKAGNIGLWVISLGIGFFAIPFINVFPEGYHDVTPDAAKPIIFGFLAAAAVRFALGCVFGERQSNGS